MPDPNQEQNQAQNQAQNQTKNPHRVAPKWYEANTSKAIRLLKDHKLYPDIPSRICLTRGVSKDLFGRNGVMELLATSKLTAKNSKFLILANTIRIGYRKLAIDNITMTEVNETPPPPLDEKFTSNLEELSNWKFTSTSNIKLTADMQNSLTNLLNALRAQDNKNPNLGTIIDIVSELSDMVLSLDQAFDRALEHLKSANDYRNERNKLTWAMLIDVPQLNILAPILTFPSRSAAAKKAREELEKAHEEFKKLKDLIDAVKSHTIYRSHKKNIKKNNIIIRMCIPSLQQFINLVCRKSQLYLDDKHTTIFSRSIDKTKTHFAKVCCKLEAPSSEEEYYA